MTAVHQSLAEKHNENLEKQCSSTATDEIIFCPTVYLCGQWEAKCENSKCTTKTIDHTFP